MHHNGRVNWIAHCSNDSNRSEDDWRFVPLVRPINGIKYERIIAFSILFIQPVSFPSQRFT